MASFTITLEKWEKRYNSEDQLKGRLKEVEEKIKKYKEEKEHIQKKLIRLKKPKVNAEYYLKRKEAEAERTKKEALRRKVEGQIQEVSKYRLWEGKELSVQEARDRLEILNRLLGQLS